LNFNFVYRTLGIHITNIGILQVTDIVFFNREM